MHINTQESLNTVTYPLSFHTIVGTPDSDPVPSLTTAISVKE